MNILITNLTNTFNYGSMMMGENLITYLNKYLKNTNFYIDASEEVHAKRLREACKYPNIYLDKIFKIKLITNKIKGVRRFERQIKDKIAYKKCHNFYDAIFILGGDDFSEIYYKIPEENNLVINALRHLERLNQASKLYMIGQTIGPYTGDRLTYAKKVLKNIKIYARDLTSAEYLKKNAIDVSMSRDLAFLNLRLQNDIDTHELLNKYHLKENEYITFVGSGILENYDTDMNTVCKDIEKIIANLKKKHPDKKIVWLSHVLNCNATDNKLLQNLDSKRLFDVVIDCELLPAYARIILGSGYFTISFRMHAAVSTFQMLRPAICISYSPKYNGVIARGLNMKELVIEAKDKKIWESKIVDLVDEKVDYIFDNYDKIVVKIKLEVENCKSIVLKTIEKIAKELNE